MEPVLHKCIVLNQLYFKEKVEMLVKHRSIWFGHLPVLQASLLFSQESTLFLNEWFTCRRRKVSL